MTSQSIRSLRHWHWSRLDATTGADKGNPTVHSHATSWLEQTRGIRLFDQTSYPSFVVFCPMQCNPCESVEWRHGMDPWRIQRGWEARTDDASAGEIWYWLEMWRTGADRKYSSYTDCGRDHRGEYFSSTECGRDRRGEQILEWVVEYSESLLWGNQSVFWMSLCETGPVDQILCRMSDVLVKSTDRCTCTLCFQFLLVVHSCSDFSHEHWRSTSQVPSHVSNHFAHLSSSSCRCFEPPLSSIVSQRKRKFAQLWPICLPRNLWEKQVQTLNFATCQRTSAALSSTTWVPSIGSVKSENHRTWTSLMPKVEVQCRRLVTSPRILGKQLRACVSDSRSWQLFDRRKTVAWGLCLWWDATQAEAMICQSTQELIPQGLFASFWNQVKKTTKIHTQRSLMWNLVRREKEQSPIRASEKQIRFLMTWQCVAFAIEGSDLNTTPDHFVPTAKMNHLTHVESVWSFLIELEPWSDHVSLFASLKVRAQARNTKIARARSERDRRHASVTQECTCARAHVRDNTKLELVLVLQHQPQAHGWNTSSSKWNAGSTN